MLVDNKPSSPNEWKNFYINIPECEVCDVGYNAIQSD